jgi:hypothetical protein
MGCVQHYQLDVSVSEAIGQMGCISIQDNDQVGVHTKVEARKDPQEIKRTLILGIATDPLSRQAGRGKQGVAKHAVQEG